MSVCCGPFAGPLLVSLPCDQELDSPNLPFNSTSIHLPKIKVPVRIWKRSHDQPLSRHDRVCVDAFFLVAGAAGSSYPRGCMRTWQFPPKWSRRQPMHASRVEENQIAAELHWCPSVHGLECAAEGGLPTYRASTSHRAALLHAAGMNWLDKLGSPHSPWRGNSTIL